MLRFTLRALAALALSAVPFVASAAEPTVPYVPTPQEVVDKMLAMARVTPSAAIWRTAASADGST